ncbi:MAG: hypothetical protein KDA25_00900, partial [Phycisphaerales bacterium]|nr:hypothetical protein [Phycisphaerales bacterium]
ERARDLLDRRCDEVPPAFVRTCLAERDPAIVLGAACWLLAHAPADEAIAIEHLALLIDDPDLGARSLAMLDDHFDRVRPWLDALTPVGATTDLGIATLYADRETLHTMALAHADRLGHSAAWAWVFGVDRMRVTDRVLDGLRDGTSSRTATRVLALRAGEAMEPVRTGDPAVRWLVQAYERMRIEAHARSREAAAWSPWRTRGGIAMRLGTSDATPDPDAEISLVLQVINVGERPLVVPALDLVMRTLAVTHDGRRIVVRPGFPSGPDVLPMDAFTRIDPGVMLSHDERFFVTTETDVDPVIADGWHLLPIADGALLSVHCRDAISDDAESSCRTVDEIRDHFDALPWIGSLHSRALEICVDRR